MNRIVPIVIVAVIVCSRTGAGQDADSLNAAAKVLLGQENYVAAVPVLRSAAEAGNPEAQYNLGVTLLEGAGIESDPVEANRWFLKAAEQGWVDAQFKLAYSYALGRGIPQNFVEAFRWFETAAEGGDAEAQFVVIGMLMNGQGVKVNLERAIDWAERLAVRKNPEDLRISGHITNARLNLARMYLNGEGGVTRNVFEAYKWLLIANENKVDLSLLVQQQMIQDVGALEKKLKPKEKERALKAAEATLGRPLANLGNLLKPEI
jgi:uncharacterized protein